jgi:hypothetical protein
VAPIGLDQAGPAEVPLAQPGHLQHGGPVRHQLLEPAHSTANGHDTTDGEEKHYIASHDSLQGKSILKYVDDICKNIFETLNL